MIYVQFVKITKIFDHENLELYSNSSLFMDKQMELVKKSGNQAQNCVM